MIITFIIFLSADNLGHFSALVPSEPYQRLDSTREEEEDVTFLPLVDCENKLIPIHFLTQAEVLSCLFFALHNFNYIIINCRLVMRRQS